MTQSMKATKTLASALLNGALKSIAFLIILLVWLFFGFLFTLGPLFSDGASVRLGYGLLAGGIAWLLLIMFIGLFFLKPNGKTGGAMMLALLVWVGITVRNILLA